MRRRTRSRFLPISALWIGTASMMAGLPTAADVRGFDFVVDADTLVYGGSWYRFLTEREEDVHTLYKERFGTNEREAVLRVDGRSLTDIQAAPQGELVGVLEHVWEEDVGEERANYVTGIGTTGRSFNFEDSILTISTLDGAILDRISRVRRYVWGPDGRRIAYVTGDYYEGGIGFSTTGTWFYDLGSRQAERIHPGGYDIHWARWDGGLYIETYDREVRDRRVLRLDPDSGRLEPTSRRGIYFSPDGGHYYNPGREGAPLELFRTDADATIAVDTAIYSPDRTRTADYPSAWFDEKTLILPSPVPGETWDYLYDIDTRAMIRTTGSVIPARRSAGRALVVEGSVVVERSVQQFEPVSPRLPTAVSFGMAFEDNALIGLRVIRIVETSPPFQAGLRADDILLLPGGPVPASAVSQTGAAAIRQLFPESDRRFSWLVRSPDGRERSLRFEFPRADMR